MGLFKALFGGGNDEPENQRHTDETFEEFVERINSRKPADYKSESADEQLRRQNRDYFVESGMGTADEYMRNRIKQSHETWRHEDKTSKPTQRQPESTKLEPITDWYMGNDGNMVRLWSDGIERR